MHGIYNMFMVISRHAVSATISVVEVTELPTDPPTRPRVTGV